MPRAPVDALPSLHAGACSFPSLGLARSALLCLSILAAGCGTSPPPVDLVFDRDDPERAFRGFVYAMETGDWDWAFETLDRESRKVLSGPFWFKWGVLIEKVPEIDRPIYDVIVESVRYIVQTIRDPRAPNQAAIEIFYMEKDAETGEYLPRATVLLFLLREEGAWKLDLIRTAQHNFGDLLRGA